MKNIISDAVKESVIRSHKPNRIKVYSLTGPKKSEAASALKVLGALNTLEHVLASITGHARRILFGAILPEWLTDVVKGGREPNAFTITSGDAKALIVPMKKYAVIDEERANKLMDLKEKKGVDIDIEETKHFELNPGLFRDLAEEKMDSIIDDLKQALLKSDAVPPSTKKAIRVGHFSIVEERSEYHYSGDVLSNLPKLSKRDPKKAEAIIEAVQPVFAIRSFEMEEKEVQVEEALDVIKESLAELPEVE